MKIILRFITPLIIMMTTFTLPLFNISGDISSLLTAIALTFAILVGFFIATATTNYINFQNYLSQEDASLIAIFNLCNIVSPSNKEKISEKIDQYTIATLDFSLTDYVEKTYTEFTQVIECIDALQPETDTKQSTVALDYLHATKIDWIKSRESISYVARKIIKNLHWIILLFLSLTLVILLLSLRTNDLLINIIVGLSSSSIYFILLLLYEIDSNIFFEEQLAFQDVQKIFKAIGKLPYYPSFAFKLAKIKKPKEYRLGIYTDYPNSLTKEIKIYNDNINKQDT